jgi:hypothetical protein
MFISCQEEEVMTAGEVAGRKIKSLHHNELCSVIVDNTGHDSDAPFTVEGQFLIVGSAAAGSTRYYDLNNLSHFLHVNTGDEWHFYFYFK